MYLAPLITSYSLLDGAKPLLCRPPPIAPASANSDAVNFGDINFGDVNFGER